MVRTNTIVRLIGKDRRIRLVVHFQNQASINGDFTAHHCSRVCGIHRITHIGFHSRSYCCIGFSIMCFFILRFHRISFMVQFDMVYFIFYRSRRYPLCVEHIGIGCTIRRSLKRILITCIIGNSGSVCFRIPPIEQISGNGILIRRNIHRMSYISG